MAKYPSNKAARDWIVKVMMDDPHLSVLIDLALSGNRRAWVESFSLPETIDEIDTPWGRMTRWFAAHTITKNWNKVWPQRR